MIHYSLLLKFLRYAPSFNSNFVVIKWLTLNIAMVNKKYWSIIDGLHYTLTMVVDPSTQGPCNNI